VLAEAGTEPGVILAEIDPALVTEVRGRIPTLKNARSFTVEVVSASETPGQAIPA
jgi:predicted amidohydrolase